MQEHQTQLQEILKGGPVSDAEVFAETHKEKKKDGSREGWVETRASEQYDGFHRSLDERCQMQPIFDDGTPIQPSPDVMTSIWTDVAGGVSKGRVYRLGVQQPSSFRPSPLVSDAPTAQNQEEMGAMQKKWSCCRNDVRWPKLTLLEWINT
ncbi:PREDICTED: uncharacterized protein LOC109212597 [Nicotiana attenuata]|uniref:uncharacterized protein LOC109212597 n=1 Tax=Nicotiana attenuata TaxID=49451 RepID=UPI000904EE53|nr:PREDICTED: uncharacterized protein LOC109212597 [Nicotiana attenuata]